MRGRRPVSFYKNFPRKAGVVLADHDIPSIELIQRASLTVAITGTACLEALLLKKPSLMFGKTFFSPWMPKMDAFDDLETTIREAMKSKPADIYPNAVDFVYRILSAGYDFVLRDPHDVALDSKHTMNYRNLDHFLNAFQDHLRRLPHA
jgi:capsule polysaccharide export protein KpsC/LpsZ